MEGGDLDLEGRRGWGPLDEDRGMWGKNIGGGSECRYWIPFIKGQFTRTWLTLV
jgi:hypothetical protein